MHCIGSEMINPVLGTLSRLYSRNAKNISVLALEDLLISKALCHRGSSAERCMSGNWLFSQSSRRVKLENYSESLNHIIICTFRAV